MCGPINQPVFVWINRRRRPIEQGLDLLEDRYGTGNCSVVFRDLVELNFTTINEVAEETNADYVVLDGEVPIRVILDLLDEPVYEERILKPAREAVTGFITRIATYLPRLATKPFLPEVHGAQSESDDESD